MHKMAVMGDRDSILGFRALGIETVPVSTAAEARTKLHHLAAEDYAVIYLTEQYAEPLKDLLAEYAEMVSPAVILIPGEGGSLGIGLGSVTDAVERAVGADILGE